MSTNLKHWGPPNSRGYMANLPLCGRFLILAPAPKRFLLFMFATLCSSEAVRMAIRHAQRNRPSPQAHTHTHTHAHTHTHKHNVQCLIPCPIYAQHRSIHRRVLSQARPVGGVHRGRCMGMQGCGCCRRIKPVHSLRVAPSGRKGARGGASQTLVQCEECCRAGLYVSEHFGVCGNDWAHA